MNLPYTSEAFEQMVYALVELLKQDGDEVTWNKRIRDPDTFVLRQIDVFVDRADGTKVHYECRNRADKQDTMWIEELFGRKASLKADEIVAVSASGFTQPAIKKAKSLCIGAWRLTEDYFPQYEILGNRPYVNWVFLEDIRVNLELHLSSAYNSRKAIANIVANVNPSINSCLERTCTNRLDLVNYDGENSTSSELFITSVDLPIITQKSGRKIHVGSAAIAIVGNRRLIRSRMQDFRSILQENSDEEGFLGEVSFDDFFGLKSRIIFSEFGADLLREVDNFLPPEKSYLSMTSTIGPIKAGNLVRVRKPKLHANPSLEINVITRID